MLRLAVPLAILATATLSGCFTPGPNNPANVSSPTVANATAQPMPYWAGSGVVQSVSPAPGSFASAGGSMSSRNPAAPSDSGLQRLGIRMDNGRMMYVDTPARDYPVGTRIELTESYEIKRM